MIRARYSFRSKGKYGFKGPNGFTVVDPIYDEVNDFYNDFAAIRIGKYWGFINIEGELAIKPQFDNVFVFSDGKALVKKKDEYFHIDTKGRKIIDIKNHLRETADNVN